MNSLNTIRRAFVAFAQLAVVLLVIAACQGEVPPVESGGDSAPERSGPRSTPAGVRDERPNIVLYISDDHGLDAYGAYGATAIQTPNLDSLAAEGTRFTHAFATSASCAVSRSVMMSGLHGHANGMYGHMHGYNHFSSFDRVRSLPVLLSESGYRTGRVGKYHLAPESVYRFDVALSEGAANDMKSIGRSPVEMAETTRGFVTANPDQPFFLLMGSDDPHRDSPTRRGDEPNTFGNRPDSYPGVEKRTFEPGQVDVPSFLPDIPQTRLEMAQYYEAVDRLDQGVGYMIGLLKETGAWDNTIFIYLSDNGIAMPGAKTTHYDPGIHLPLVVRLPDAARPGHVQDAMVSWADLTPTILEWAEATPADYEFHGRSFASVVESEVEGWDEVYASHTFHEVTMYYPMRTVRTRDFKLIWNIAWRLEYPFASDLFAALTWRGTLQNDLAYFGKRKVEDYLFRSQYELYDLRSDPHEAVNLADDPAYAGVRDELLAKLKSFQQETGDPWRLKWEYE
jgi:N-sulfoglucosamine sulfohydrolase